MYTTTNYKTKKALKEAFKAGEQITVYQPGGMFPGETDGTVCCEGPHYPSPHKWWCQVVIADSIITKIIG